MDNLGPPKLGFPPYIIGIFVVHGFAILSSCFRLGYRSRKRQLHWDDFWAFFAFLCDLEAAILFLVLCLYDHTTSGPTATSFILWNTSFFSPTQIWATRLSIAITVLRILPPGRTRVITKGAIWTFVLFWGIVMIQTIFMCGTPVPMVPRCNSTSSAVLNVIVNTLGTVWLIVWPAYILLRTRFNVLKFSKIKVPMTQHRLLLGCFSSSILLLAVNISHDIYIWNFTYDQVNLAITGHLEIALSLMICNCLVLVGPMYRFFVPETHGGTVTGTTASSSRLGSKFTFSRGKDPVEIYASTQVYTLTEYPPSSQELGEHKENGRASLDTNSISSKKATKEVV